MAEPTAEERRAELAEAFAAGLDIFRTREEERKAKEAAANPPKDEPDDKSGGKSWSERILGF